jgi:ABC-2 type transport system ATP-binding protein
MALMGELLADVAAAGATVLFSSHQLDLVEDLCEDVVIIDHGRVVLSGSLDEVRAAVPERVVEIRYQGAAPDWSTLPSVELVAAKKGEARLRVGSDADFASVVAIARGTPDIISFAYQPPTLSELFRRAVAA